MTMTDLVALGASELPSGYFYRIKLDFEGRIYIQIREDRKRFGSKCRHEQYYLLNFLGDEHTWKLPGMLLDTFEKFYATYERTQLVRSRFAEIETFVGDHR